jgi:Ser/Thr protein kinase RdoA (MazF antagonist)
MGVPIDGLQDDDRRAFLRAREWVEGAYASLDRADLRVIHCDLWHENVKLDGGRLRPFDFEDTVWGYRLHDLAMGLLDLLETVGPERYPDLLAACRSGYERLLAWPEGDLEVLQIGRLLWQANWVARFQPASFGAMGEAHGRVFRGFGRAAGYGCRPDAALREGLKEARVRRGASRRASGSRRTPRVVRGRPPPPRPAAPGPWRPARRRCAGPC